MAVERGDARQAMEALSHQWRWRGISPYLDRIAAIARGAAAAPLDFAERRQLPLPKPGLGGWLQVMGMAGGSVVELA